MAGFGTKVVAVLMTILPGLLLLSSSVEAVDILIYTENGCSGTSTLGCFNLPANSCCTINATSSPGAPSIQIVSLLAGESAIVYTGGGCTLEVASLVGPNAGECFFNDSFTGAFWY